MKKTISLLLTVLMLLSLGGMAWADGGSIEKVWTGELSGIELWIPMEFRTAKGSLEFIDSGEGYTPGEGILSVSIDYIAMPAKECDQLSKLQMDAFLSGDLDKLSEINDQFAGKILPIGSIIALSNGRGEAELRAWLMEQNLDPVYYEGEEELFKQVTELYENLDITPIGERDGYAYFLCAFNPDLLLGFCSPEVIGADYLKEYLSLLENKALILDNIRLTGGVQAAPAVVEEPFVVEEPAVEEPFVIEEPAVEEPFVVEEPTVEEPFVVEEPTVEEPFVVEEPAVEEPVAEEPAELENYEVIEAPYVGFRFELPERYQNIRGKLSWSGGGPLSMADPGIVEIAALYYAIPDEDWDAFVAYTNARFEAIDFGTEEPEAPKSGWDDEHICGCLFDLIGIDGNRGLKELLPFLAEYNEPYGAEFISLEKLGKEGDTTFYLAQYAKLEDETDAYSAAMGELYDEFTALCADRDAFLSGLTLSEPLSAHAESNGAVSFKTTDLSGNEVTSEELFAGHKVTMLNLWATWCGPCRGELGELGKLAREFEKQGCQIVGVCLDGAEAGREAKALLKENGADFLNLVCTDDIEDQLFTLYVPTSFFVDSEGNLLGDPIVGAQTDLYPEALAEALAVVG